MINCLECKKKEMNVEYIGETSRTTYERGGEHLRDLVGEVPGKPLWEHAKEEHGGETQTSWYKISVTEKHKTALQRQLREALNIERSEASVVLNKKNEWNGSRILRLRVEVGECLDKEVRDKRGNLNLTKSERRIQKVEQQKRGL